MEERKFTEDQLGKLTDDQLKELNERLARCMKETAESATRIGDMLKSLAAAMFSVDINENIAVIEKAVETFGISMKNVDGSMRPAFDVITELANKVELLQTGAQGLHALEQYGHSIQEMVDGVKEWHRQAEALRNSDTDPMSNA